ncbi:hypothetical protein DOY81_001986 [Sarcophaga bullata]|nr:hypothetical protein DOY81_001986 [Sarcophaga bullata]
MIFKGKARGGFTFMVFLVFIAFNSTTGRRYARQTSANEDNNSNNNNNYYHRPHFIGNRSVIVQLFEWKFVDIATECRTFLGPQGYAGVQLSPVLEHTVVKTEQLNHPWWERYEVVSYRLASRSGDEAEFWSMSRICNEHGVRIYVDIVLNHMAAPLHLLVNGVKADFMVNTLLESNVNISSMSYSNVTYTQLDFHKINCQVLYNARDAHDIRNCQWKHHPDLDHYRNGVKKHIVTMMNKFIDMGVAGFRIDAAKYMWPIDLKNIYQQLKDLSKEFDFEPKSRPFIYQDVFDFGLDSVSKTEYITYGVVSEYLYAAELATILNGMVSLSSLINWGPALGFVPSTDSLVFIDSHDTQRGLPLDLGQNRVLTYKQRIKYIMANVFMLAHPYGGIKRIMSSYYFQDEDQGPPTDDSEGEDISSPQFNEQKQCTKASGWVCEHRWPPLVAMVQMANYFAVPGQQEESIVYFQTNGQNQVAFCRGSLAFVAINNDVENDFNMEVFACLESGQYCDVVTGGKKAGKEECHGKQLLINEHGYAKLQLPVADGNRLVEADIENKVDEAEKQQEEEAEEETGVVESYGILVIYRGSKIEPREEFEGKSETSQDSHNQDKESADSQANSETAEVEDAEAADAQTAEAVEAKLEAAEPDAAEPEAVEPEATEADVIETEAADPEASEPEAGETEAAEAEAEAVEGDATEAEAEAAEVEATEDEVDGDEEEEKEIPGSEESKSDLENESPEVETPSRNPDGQADSETAEVEDAEAADAQAAESEAVEPEATEADVTETEAAEPEAAEPEAAEPEPAGAEVAETEAAEAEAETENDVENESSEVENPNADNENEEKDEVEEAEEEDETKTAEQDEEDNAVEEEAKEDDIEVENSESAGKENEVEDKDALTETSQQISNEIENEVEEPVNEGPITDETVNDEEAEIEAEPHGVADLVVSETSVEENVPASQNDLEEITENVEKGTDSNQSRNLEDPNTEEQVERPLADIVKDSEEGKTKEVLAAGILSNPKGNGKNG